ncbi:MAG: TIGR00304 family membrane protein [Vulcanisaeta sp.]
MMNAAYIISMAIALSVILMFIGILLIILDVVRSHREEGNEEKEREEKRKTGVGGVVLIGPVPIVFGNDPSIIKWAIILTIIVVVLFVVFALLPGIL